MAAENKALTSIKNCKQIIVPYFISYMESGKIKGNFASKPITKALHSEKLCKKVQ